MVCLAAGSKMLPGMASGRAHVVELQRTPSAVQLCTTAQADRAAAGELAIKATAEELVPVAMPVLERLVLIMAAPLGHMPRSIIENRRAPCCFGSPLAHTQPSARHACQFELPRHHMAHADVSRCCHNEPAAL